MLYGPVGGAKDSSEEEGGRKGEKLQRTHGLRGPGTSVRNRARWRTRAIGTSTGRKQVEGMKPLQPSCYLAPPQWEDFGDNIRQLVNWKRGGCGNNGVD